MTGDDGINHYEVYEFREGGVLVQQIYVPAGDTRAHLDQGMDCWCKPSATNYLGMHVVVHNSWDWREFRIANVRFSDFVVDGKHMVGFTTCVSS